LVNQKTVISIAKHKPLSLRQNFSWTIAGNLIASGCQWAELMIMAKLLSLEQVGYYALALAITTPVIMFSLLQLRSVEITDTQDQYQFSDYFGLRLITNLLSVLAVVVVLLFLGARYSFDFYLVVFLVAISKAIDAASDISYGVMQKHERLDKAALSLVYRHVGALVILAPVLYFTQNLTYGVAGMSLWWLLILISYDRNNVEKFDRWAPKFRFRHLLCIAWIGLPLGISRGIISLGESTPRYFIEATLGTANLGIFAAMAYTVTIANRFVEALGYSVAARLAKYFAYNHRAYIKMLLKVTGIAVAMALVTVVAGVLFGKQILTVLYKAEYAQQPGVFILLLTVAGAKMISSMLNHGMYAAKRFKSQVPLDTVALLACFVSCYYLVPAYGLKGAAVAMLVSVAVKIAGTALVIRLALKRPFGAEEQTAKSLSEKPA
jgi:O-antigen/teichoic acid export membrane protein